VCSCQGIGTFYSTCLTAATTMGNCLSMQVTGKYQRLPKDSRAYPTLNTDTIPYYRITVGGILAK
jgi:hypothetical protein